MNPRVILVGTTATGAAVAALLDAAAKAGLLFAAAAVVVWVVGKRSSAATRHLVWLCALTGALLLPLSFRLLPQWHILPAWMRWEEVPRLFSAGPPATPEPVHPTLGGESSADSTFHAAPIVATPELPRAAKPLAPPPRPIRVKARWILTLWASVAAVCLLPIAASVLKLRRLSVRSKAVTAGPLFDAVSGVAGELGLKRPPQLLLGTASAMPMVWGLFRPTLLLPDGAADWPSRRLRTVLLHELCHLRRRDPLALLLAHLAAAIHWFNPLAWLALAGIRREQELACDDCVLRHGIPSSGYAEEMLSISTSQALSNHPAALAMARPSGLESRITTILDPNRNRRAITRRIAAVAAGTALLVGLPLAMLRAAPADPNQRGRLLDRNGLVLADTAPDGSRRYPYGALAAHSIGHLKPSAKQGVLGAELLFETQLQQGREVSLTLDARLQHHAEAVFRNTNIGRGAVVVLDCADGGLLASVSVPSFDPNDFVPGISKEQWKAYHDNPAYPFANRTLASQPPGSPFKLVTALAACRAGNAADHHTCDGFVTYGNLRFGCWIWNSQRGSHGDLPLHDAITRSCNPYFYLAAEKIGPEKLAETGTMLGFGQPTGIGLTGESAGVMPAPGNANGRTPGIPAGPAQTANTAIGQGTTQATPLQLASLAAGLGSGRIFVPRLDRDSPPRLRIDLVEAGWKAENLEMIRLALVANVHGPDGIARRAQSSRIEIAGASGTCQTMDRGKPSHAATFIGFAPASAPRYAIAVVVENAGSGGKVAAPLARMILEGLAGDLPPPASLPPAKGNLDRLESIE
jgi:beta-lactamase regulating signal transducer with metallopeptidase domain